MTRRYPTPEVAISADERGVIKQLAPLRRTLEKLVRSQHERHGPVSESAYAAAVELHYTLLLEAYNRGVSTMRVGLHRGEGVDHETLDDAISYALEQSKGDASGK
jgi:hypothetical protein